MKTTLIAVVAALAFSAFPAAHAEQNEQNLTQVKVSAQAYVSPDAFADFANTYRLSNGQKVMFSQSGNRFFAQVDNGKRVRILPVSAREFETVDGARIAFREYGDEVGITNFERLPMAQPMSANTIVVARR